MRGRRWPGAAMIAIALALLAGRGPQMWLQPGGMDEDWFAVPGWTAATEGIPRAPYAPNRLPESAFYRADVAMFALPPAYFYWQAPLYWILPAGYGVARLASALAGVLALVAAWRLGVRAFGSPGAALIGAALFSVSRVFYFPATTARPDALCAALGLAAVLCVWGWREQPSWRALLAAGALLGLGMLTHPFAIVYCAQCGVWTLWPRQGWRPQVGSAAALTLTALAVFALWLPLILAYPEVFQAQFFNNVLDRSGPTLLGRALWPWELFAYHARLLWERAGPLQLGLMLGGLCAATAIDFRGQRGPRALLLLAWSSTYLLVVFQGAHPSQGYWMYPSAFCFLGVGRVLTWLWRRAPEGFFRRAAAAVGMIAVLLALMVPGSGVRAWWTYVRRGADPDYNRTRFVQRLLEDLPEDARYIVDPAYVFDFYLAGRDVVLGVNAPFYFAAEAHPFDYYVASRYGLANNIPQALEGRRIAAYGRPHDPIANYAEVYVPANSPD